MQPSIPADIVALDRLFELTLTAFATTKALATSLRATDGTLPAWRGLEDDAIESEVKHLAAIVAARAIDSKSRLGNLLELDVARLLAPLRDSVAQARRKHRYGDGGAVMQAAIDAVWSGFRPSLLWQQIETENPPSTIEHAAAVRAAETIVRSFRFRRSQPMRVVKGKVELEMGIYRDHISRGPALSWDDAERITQLHAALVTFATHTFDGPALNAFLAQRWVIDDLAKREVPVTSRARFDLGAGIEVVTYLDVFKFYLPQPMAQALNAYLQLHAPGQLSAA